MKIYHNAIKNLKVSSKYGKRTHPITGEKNKMHYGTDIYTNGTDKNIYALEEGYVQKTVKNQSSATTGYGNYIWVRYPRINRSVMYAHCSKILLNKGDTVKKDTPIAVIGSTGLSTGPHVHVGMTEIGKDEWLDTDAYEYTPAPVKVEPNVDFEKIIEELNKKVVELEEEIDKLTADTTELQKELDEERLYKFSHTVEETTRYSIDLNVGEILIVK